MEFGLCVCVCECEWSVQTTTEVFVLTRVRILRFKDSHHRGISISSENVWRTHYCKLQYSGCWMVEWQLNRGGWYSKVLLKILLFFFTLFFSRFAINENLVSCVNFRHQLRWQIIDFSRILFILAVNMYAPTISIHNNNKNWLYYSRKHFQTIQSATWWESQTANSPKITTTKNSPACAENIIKRPKH